MHVLRMRTISNVPLFHFTSHIAQIPCFNTPCGYPNRIEIKKHKVKGAIVGSYSNIKILNTEVSVMNIRKVGYTGVRVRRYIETCNECRTVLIHRGAGDDELKYRLNRSSVQATSDDRLDVLCLSRLVDEEAESNAP